MKLKYETKVQTQGGTLATSIPKTIRDALNLKKGDTIEWTFCIDTQTISIGKR